eukprot:snap_masked-scaffold_4-processed-gene-4.13-mRNA-1 protein AED:1.00 eAED:1.00 QI:0/0/0/0/1/1/3/0/149
MISLREERTLPVTPTQAVDIYLNEHWGHGLGTDVDFKLVEKGDEDMLGAYSSSERYYWPMNLREKIIKVEKPFLVQYTVTKTILPFSDHLGTVEINPLEDERSCVFTYKIRMKAIFGFKFLIERLIENAMKGIADAIEQRAKELHGDKI